MRSGSRSAVSWKWLDVASRALLLAAFFAFGNTADAQTTGATISGVVKDALTGAPVEGVSVTVVGAPKGDRSRADGRYTIANVSDGVYAIEARRVGYQLARQSNIRVADGAAVTVNFDVSQNTLQLSAITSSATVDPISGMKAPFAIAKLDAEAFPVPVTGAAQALAYKVPGVSVTRGSGDPNDEPWVLLRSMSSPFKSNGPLWVIDGIPLNTPDGVRTNDIQSMDIANVEIIKGAAAAAQYGSQAAGGVISITTHKGKDVGLGTTEITVRQDMGYDAPANIPEKRQYHQYLMNAEGQWINGNGVVVNKSGRVTAPDRMMDNPYPVRYDNLKQALRPNQKMVSAVSLRQNSVSTNFSLSYNRTDNPGVFRYLDQSLDQNVRFNVTHQFRDNLDFTLGLNHARQTQDENQASFSTLFSFDPDVNLLRPDITGARFVITPDSASTNTNPLYLNDLRDYQVRNAQTDFNVNGRYTPITWLTFDGLVGYRRQDNVRDRYEPSGAPDTDGLGFTDGTIDLRERETNIGNASFGGTLLGNIGSLTSRLRLGGEMRRNRRLEFSANGTGFTTTGIRDLAAASNRTNSSATTEARVNSLVSSAALDYNGRYVLNGSFRREGNSLFGRAHRYNNFYGAGASWIMSSESWYPAFLDRLNLFKFRYNYGTAGTEPDFADQYETITVSTAGFVRSGLGNKDLEPEVKTDHEFGVDLLLNNRVSLAYNYVKTMTRGAIVGVEAPASSGFNTYTKNAGGTHGYSHELLLEGQVLRRPNGLTWTMSVSGSRNATDVDFYGRTCYAETPAVLYRCPGVPVTDYWGGHFMRDVSELPASRQPGAAQWQVDNNGFLVPVGTGNNWWEGVEKGLWGTVVTIDGVGYNWGVPQLQWDDSSSSTVFKKIGNWQPDLEYGWTNRFNRGQFVMGFTFGGQIGGDIYNKAARDLYSSLDHPNAVQVGVPDSLRKGVEYYSGGGTGSLGTGTYNDFFIRSGTHLKLKEANVGYTLDAKRYQFLNKLGASRMNLQLSGRDLFRYMPGYDGLDPEGFLNLSGGIQTRMDQLRYPPARSFTGSVSFVF
jgi:TonB-linked SusC/RagA family outer membrane protein